MSDKLEIGPGARVLVVTGSGVSQESGIPTYRDMGGLWDQVRFEEVASMDGFDRDPALVWRFYAERRAKAGSVKPNAGHFALAELEKRLGDDFLMVTQNVDELHTDAGSQRVIELHGSVFRTKCRGCARAPFADRTAWEKIPACGQCGSLLRPAVVWFGEMIDPGHLDRIEKFLKESHGKDLWCIVAGTSGAVWPAAGLVDAAARIGATTVLVNAEEADNQASFGRFYQGKSGDWLPRLL